MCNQVLRKPNCARLLILWLIVTLLPFACARQASPTITPQPETTPTAEPGGRGAGGTLCILYWQAPSILNPHLGFAQKDWDPSRMVYEPLATADKDGNLIPILAAEIPSLENGGVAADGKSVTWKLRRDVRWSDGEPFTADDVLFTYQYISNPKVNVVAASAATYAAVESVQVIDPYTVKVHFSDVSLLGWSLPFVGPRGAILPRHVFEAYNGPNASEAPANREPAVGTGPYRVLSPGIKPQEILFLGTQLVETNVTVFEPNPYFREPDKPFFSRVELKGGAHVNEAARLVLQASAVDRVDFAWNIELDADKQAQMEAAGLGKVIAVPGPFVERILLNRTDPQKNSSLEYPHPFFNDKRVRQAFAHAIDRDRIAALYGLAGEPTTNILVAPPAYNSPNTFYTFDLARAAALLDEAGWVDSDGDGIRDKGGVEMKVVFQTTANNPVRQETQKIVQEALQSIQVDVELQVDDPPTFALVNSPRFFFDMQEFYDGNVTPNPEPYMKYWTVDQIPQQDNNWSGRNLERWVNPAYDALYTQSTTETDPEKRRQLFIQMNDMIVEDVVLIPLVNRAQVFAVSNTLQGVDLTPWDSALWNIKDWRRE